MSRPVIMSYRSVCTSCRCSFATELLCEVANSYWLTYRFCHLWGYIFLPDAKPSECWCLQMAVVSEALDHHLDPESLRFLYRHINSLLFNTDRLHQQKTPLILRPCVNRLLIVLEFVLWKRKTAFAVEVFSALNRLKCLI